MDVVKLRTSDEEILLDLDPSFKHVAQFFFTKRKIYCIQQGINGLTLLAQMVKNLPTMQETLIQSLGQEDPLEKETATLQYSCLENSKDRGA